jgi:hypothetical protein
MGLRLCFCIFFLPLLICLFQHEAISSKTVMSRRTGCYFVNAKNTYCCTECTRSQCYSWTEQPLVQNTNMPTLSSLQTGPHKGPIVSGLGRKALKEHMCSQDGLECYICKFDFTADIIIRKYSDQGNIAYSL